MKNLIYLLSLVVLFFSSCDKSMDIASPDFEASTKSATYKAGDTVTFNFTGNADVITFNSGEKGDLLLSFASQTRFGSQPNQISVQVSTDFNGKYTEADVKAATWIDVSSRFTFGTNTTLVSSGVKSISDLTQSGKPLYIAFKYVGQANTTNTMRNWWINNLSINNALAGTTTNVLVQATADYKFVNFVGNPAGVGWSALADGRILFDPKGSLAYAEGWAIAKPIEPGGLKSSPAPIKAFIDAQMDNYKYVFFATGVYTVTFEAANANRFDNKKVIRELTITVTP